MADIVSKVAEVDPTAPLLDIGHSKALIVCVQRYRSLSVNESRGLIMSQYENPPMLLVEIILSIHSVGSFDLSFFIN